MVWTYEEQALRVTPSARRNRVSRSCRGDGFFGQMGLDRSHYPTAWRGRHDDLAGIRAGQEWS